MFSYILILLNFLCEARSAKREAEDFFVEKVVNFSVEKGSVYTVFVKIRYSFDNFAMAGNQFGRSYKDIDSCRDLREIVVDKVNITLDNFSVIWDDIVYIQVYFRKLHILYKGQDVQLNNESLKLLTIKDKK